jgi:hypothetical protein
MKLTFRLLAVVAILALVSCGGAKYGDFVKLAKDFLQAIDTYVAAVEKAPDGKTAAKAILDFASKTKNSEQDFDNMAKKYPELKSGQGLDPEIAKLVRDVKDVDAKFKKAETALDKFRNDPDVKAALKSVNIF